MASSCFTCEWLIKGPPSSAALATSPTSETPQWSLRTNWSTQVASLESLRAKALGGERLYKCSVESCGELFSNSKNFSRHKRLHQVSKFRCPVVNCSKLFKSAERLENHLKAHVTRSAYPCGVVGCTKTFSTSGNLGRHFRTRHLNGSTTPPSRSGRRQSRVASVPQPSMRAGDALLGADLTEDFAFAPYETPPRDPLLSEEVLDFLNCLFVDSPSKPLTEDAKASKSSNGIV